MVTKITQIKNRSNDNRLPADKAYKNQNKQDFSKHVLEARAVLKKAKML